ncbi:unnamed protein product [Effrenium voratum]|uniref:Uncharacterized protein n=1 Tax=Effrenium voratum TaxID=2562239 RepID=A0AA36JTP6_9DINO|nr:unnamed protein product [Effrenium voratum]
MSVSPDHGVGHGLCRLRSPNSFDQVARSGHFRAATARRVLMGFGMIFDGSLSSLLAAAPVESMRCPTKQQVQLAGDVLFRASAETDRVDVFIGHSWSAGRWQKFLALCLFFNLDLAVSCSLGTCGVAIAALLGSRGMTGLGGSSLAMPCLVYLPMTVFFAVFFFGQKLCERRSPSVWVDKLCIHQTDMGLKAEQIAALPVFVARSSRMLILWDETYFERLWCNLELATFSRHGGAEKVELLPLWLAPWLLFSILSDLLSATIFEVLEHVFPNWSVAWMDGIIGMAERVLGHNPAMLKFVVWFVIWMISSIVYLPASIPSFFSFRMKLRNHQLLLDQMAGFDVRKAKCTVPTDREAIEQQVKELFKEEHRPMSWLPPEGVDEGEVSLDNRLNRLWRMDPLDSFNAYIRGALRENVITQIGKEPGSLGAPIHDRSKHRLGAVHRVGLPVDLSHIAADAEVRVVQWLSGFGAALSCVSLLPIGLCLLLHLREPHLGLVGFAGAELLSFPAAGLHVGHDVAGCSGHVAFYQELAFEALAESMYQATDLPRSQLRIPL